VSDKLKSSSGFSKGSKRRALEPTTNVAVSTQNVARPPGSLKPEPSAKRYSPRPSHPIENTQSVEAASLPKRRALEPDTVIARRTGQPRPNEGRVGPEPAPPVNGSTGDAPIETASDPNVTPQQREAETRAQKDRVAAWKTRIADADKVYEAWEKKFECKTLVNYWEGRQWKGATEDEAGRAYVVNLFYSSIETKLPTLMFYKPDYKVTARPGHVETEGSNVEARAKLCEEALQSVTDDPRTLYRSITGLAMKDAEFRFGVIEVGYSANWIDNPNVGRPVLKDGNEVKDEAGEPIKQPAQVLDAESVYLKRIPPENFRVSKRPESLITQQDWVAYFEWVYVEDVKRNPAYQNTEDLKATGSSNPKRRRGEARDNGGDEHVDMVKLWKIWDLRGKTKCVVAEGHDLPLVEYEPWQTFPICDLKYVERPSEYYPIPPTFNGRIPQDEVNRIRERQKNHGERYVRKYTYYTDSMDEGEVEKIEKGGDGTIARRKVANPAEAIMPIPDANLHPYTTQDLQSAKDDFHQVVGITAEQEGVAESDTATQANILNTNSQIRTTSQRVIVADWLAEIGRAMLGVIIEKMQLPFWIQRTMDPQALQQPPQGPAMMLGAGPGQMGQMSMPQTIGAQAQALGVAKSYQQITSQKLGDVLGIDVSVDVGSLSPAAQANDVQAWMMVFEWLSNPPTLLALATSDVILKKLLTSAGLRSAQDLTEVRNLARMILMSGMAQGPQQTGATGSPAGQTAGIPSQGMGVQ
jgi:hypothetical protein